MGALLLSVSLLGQGTWALAGTTGGLSGTVVDTETSAPISGELVTAKSPSQTASATTDASGHFTFLSLAPDTYTVTASKTGYDDASVSGVVVFADTVQSVAITAHKALKTIANVRTVGTGNLVKSGTTADVYSVSSSSMEKINALGGGGSLNSAYSAVASVPGAIMPLNQTGYFQTVHIRGGDYDQVGYEFDGVPVNRSFDNYPSGALSSLGNAELQVYTGATPANSEGQGLAGYINQVIKTGTYPGFASLSLGAGTPVFYHHLMAEAGGASPNRNFSYYAGLGGYNQDYRYVDQNNAAKYTYLGAPLLELAPPSGNCNPADPTNWAYSFCYNNTGAGGSPENFAVGPGGYQQLPFNYGSVASVADRDVVMNFHFGLPHKYDSGRDDIQLLWNSAMLHNVFYSSLNDAGGAGVYNNPQGAGNPLPYWLDNYQSNCATGTLLNTTTPNCVVPYLYPNSPGNRQANLPTNQPPGIFLDPNQRDTIWNDQEIIKAQYQKNIGSNAYVRLYGYTYYSDWLQNGPNCAYNILFNYGTCAVSPDYELSSHTRGASIQIADQVSAAHLLQVQANYTTANSIRDNNTQILNAYSGSRGRAFVLVDGNNPYNGTCYNASAPVGGQAAATSCNPSPAFATWGKLNKGTAGNSLTDYSGLTCGTGPCKYLVAENGLYATYNQVVPKFSSISLSDQWRPGSKWLFNIGLRDDRFEFDGSNTNPNDPARQFWFNAFNTNFCINNSNGKPVDKSGLGLAPGTGQTMAQVACPAGFSALGTGNFPLMVNASGQVESYNKLQPRLSGTYTVDPLTVLRFSAGEYVEPPNTAYEQYNVLQENLGYFLGTHFYQYGFNTPGHAVRPPTSNNFDFSFEHQFKGTDLSFKITPFYRKTKDQIQNFFLDQQTGFISGLNVGSQTSEGVELALSKGNFAANGLAAQLAFTYTNSYINYGNLANGLNITSQINSDIVNYNSYTSFCSTHAGDARCAGGSQLGVAAACYTTGGAPDAACAAGDVANPYWNAPVQPLLSSTANYPVYDIFPGGIGGSADSFEYPYSATLVLNWKHDKLAITPSFQLLAGNRYGSPETNAGVDPAGNLTAGLAGCNALSPSVASNDPRYPYGAAGGGSYEAMSCNGTIVVPNTYTHTFDLPGSFVNPSQFLMNLQISYDVSPKVTLVGTFANLINRCFGGTKQAWTYNDSNVCAYGIINNAGDFSPMGNVYNWTTANTQFPASAQPFLKYPYGAALGGVNVDGNSTLNPFNFYLEAKIKL
ncbi:MAG TPA: TonB-dependent receptor [Candidatus Baltobacteraceae bacterium]|nr:TonB-dependent receptor [Candidatus Baltobacteraceae bacterium]